MLNTFFAAIGLSLSRQVANMHRFYEEFLCEMEEIVTV